MRADEHAVASRSTRQRGAIQQVIAEAGRPLSPQEILALAQERVPNLGIATVYRNLKLLVDAQQLVVVELPGYSPRFEAVGQLPHHHFQCRDCDRVFDVPHAEGDSVHAVPRGFKVEHHELTLYGVCRDCGRSSRQREPRRQR